MTQEVITHAGVKGMKWGVRKDRNHEGEIASRKSINKADSSFEKSTKNGRAWVQIQNMAADKTNANDISRINNKPEYQNVDFRKDSPIRQKYIKEHMDAHLKNVVSAAESLGTNASGTKKYGILAGSDGSWNVYLDEVKHADSIMKFLPDLDSMGRIVSVSILSDETLSHAGVKGMKWGVRKDRRSADSISTSALRKKGVKGMSNSELKRVNERLNLERNFNKMNPSAFKSGKSITKGILGLANAGVGVYNLYNSPAGKAAVAAGKQILKKR